ncbi:PAAR domain-containing protein [Erwinia sorbitola]|uniref:PAAR domain-containing protein n=1 Tax=Erwinia sorbitola TaxID=2681984 RepID=A0A6I6EK46_9GAMM|nr:PAAR domain-containing protein [Erwinia sorbitola]QGU86971.1 PAAR domain-containing protein [Erwinia sorbitola]
MASVNRGCIVHGRNVGLDGDKTSTGSECYAGRSGITVMGKLQLFIGDKTSPCPKCGEIGFIASGDYRQSNEGVDAAVDGSPIVCSCPNGTNFLIAPDTVQINAPPRTTWATTPTDPEQRDQTAKKKRTGVDAGFCLIPQQSTTDSFENTLFAGVQPDGTRELYRLLNGTGKEYKAGSILLIVDPEKQDSEQILHMQQAKARVDAALDPLTYEEANFLHKHYATIANFSNIADKGIGLAADPVGKYFENIEKILKEIQTTYKNTYITRGALIGEQFYVKRSQLFKELESVLKFGFLNKAMKLGEYTKLKNALGLSTSSITHKWNKAGVGDIEGYATHIERAAKYVKAMRYTGYIGIAFSAVHSMNEINEACSVGREAECTKKKYTEIGSFALGTSVGVAGGALAMPLCVAIGAGTAGVGGLICIVIAGTSLGYAGSSAGGVFGEWSGEQLYDTFGH